MKTLSKNDKRKKGTRNLCHEKKDLGHMKSLDRSFQDYISYYKENKHFPFVY